jgi:hypothetical protein
MPYGPGSMSFKQKLACLKHLSQQRGPTKKLKVAVEQFNRAVFAMHHKLNTNMTLKSAIASATQWLSANGKGDLEVTILVSGKAFDPAVYEKFFSEKAAEVAAEQAAFQAAEDTGGEEDGADEKKKKKGPSFSLPEIPTSLEDFLPGLSLFKTLFPKDLELTLGGSAVSKVDDPDVPEWVKSIVQSMKDDVFPSLTRGFEDLHNIFTPNKLTEGDMSFDDEGLIDIAADDLPQEDKTYQKKWGDRTDKKNRKTWGYGGRVKTPLSLIQVFGEIEEKKMLSALEKLLKKGSKLIKPQSMSGALPNGAACEASSLPGRFMEYSGSVKALPAALKSATLQTVSTLLDVHSAFADPAGAAPPAAAAPAPVVAVAAPAPAPVVAVAAPAPAPVVAVAAPAGAADARTIFDQADTNDDGVIDEREFGMLVDSVGTTASVNKAELFAQVDTDGNGTIDFDELEVKLEVVTVSTTDDEPADDESADDASADDAASDDVELAISSLHHHGPISMTEIIKGVGAALCVSVVVAIPIVLVAVFVVFKKDDEPSSSGGYSNEYYSSGGYQCAPVCEPHLLANGNCDSACNNNACGYDYGDCEYYH